MIKCKSEQLSCCHQRYLACKHKEENDRYFANMLTNREPTRLFYMKSLLFDQMDDDPKSFCANNVKERGDNNIKTPLHLFNKPDWFLETTKNSFVNGPVCKQDNCCYLPSHQTFMNLTKQT